MEKSKNAKTKYLIAIIFLVASVIATAGALIGVYAASSQSVGTQFLINYKLNNDIAVEVSAQYEFEGSTPVSLGSVTFDVNSSQSTAYLGTQSVIDITYTTPVLFTYTFKNISKTQDVMVTPSWTNFSSDISNITLFCTKLDETSASMTITSASDMSQLSMELPAEAEYKLTFLFSVSVMSQSAYVSSSATGGLTFDMAYLA